MGIGRNGDMLENTPPTDVNTATGESSTPVAETNNAPASSQEPSLAEALKTESAPSQEAQHENYVPYDRFQEVVKARQELESKFQSQDWQDYQKINEALQKDPVLGQVMMESVANYYKQFNQTQQQSPFQQQVPPQNPNAPVDPIQQLQNAYLAQEQQLQMILAQQQQANYQLYAADFEKRASEAKVPDHWKPVYENAIRQLVGTTNPNALSAYDERVIAQAFDHVHKQIDALQRAERARYVTDKTKDNLPVSTSGAGATPRVVSGENTPESRRAELVELLMAQQG